MIILVPGEEKVYNVIVFWQIWRLSSNTSVAPSIKKRLVTFLRLFFIQDSNLVCHEAWCCTFILNGQFGGASYFLFIIFYSRLQFLSTCKFQPQNNINNNVSRARTRKRLLENKWSWNLPSFLHILNSSFPPINIHIPREHSILELLRFG